MPNVLVFLIGYGCGTLTIFGAAWVGHLLAERQPDAPALRSFRDRHNA